MANGGTHFNNNMRKDDDDDDDDQEKKKWLKPPNKINKLFVKPFER